MSRILVTEDEVVVLHLLIGHSRLEMVPRRELTTHQPNEGRKEMFYLTTHILFTVIWRRTTEIVREETRCRHMGYSFRSAARVILYASSHRQDSTCYTSRGARLEREIAEWVHSMKDRSDHERKLLIRSYISLPAQ